MVFGIDDLLALFVAIPLLGWLVSIAGALGLIAIGTVVFQWASFTLASVALFAVSFFVLMKIAFRYIDAGVKPAQNDTLLVLTVIALAVLLLASNNLGIIKLGVFSASITP